MINAPPQRVWQYIIAYPANNAPADYWLWRLGLPSPVQSTASGQGVGAKRQCLFTGNIAFEEKLTEVTPGKRLTFDVTTQPNHPEVVGHFALQTGQFTPARQRQRHDNTDRHNLVQTERVPDLLLRLVDSGRYSPCASARDAAHQSIGGKS